MSDTDEKYQVPSLDDFIRQKRMSDQFSMINYRKKKHTDKNINQDDLDKSLDQYIRDSQVGANVGLINTGATSSKQSSGKFDRKSMRDSDDSDEDDDRLEKTIVDNHSSDVEMDDASKMDTFNDDDSDFDLGFQTVESRCGIRIRSQNWRMLPENLVDRPEGVKRLEVIPYDECERFKPRSGRVSKNRRNRNNSLSASLQTSKTSMVSGKFIEKGKFTFKIGDRNKDGGKEGLIGIERAKLNNNKEDTRADTVNATTSGGVAPPIQINMNWNGFFEGLTNCVEKIRDPVSTTDSSEVHSAASRLLAALQNKRTLERTKFQNKNLNLSIQKEIANIQGRPLIIEDNGDGEQTIVATAGAGMEEEIDIKPQTTRIPMNIRFTN